MDYYDWKELKSTLPGFGYLNVLSGSQKNDFITDFSVDVEDFWKSLNFEENVIHRYRNTEL